MCAREIRRVGACRVGNVKLVGAECVYARLDGWRG